MPMQEEGIGELMAGRLADGGPRYTETPVDPTQQMIAEPWNAATAALFILIALVWAWRLRGRYRQHAFLTCGLPVLLAGGIGGTLYHATRASQLYFLLDVIPISVLALGGAAYLALRLFGRRHWWYLPAILAFYLAVHFVLFRTLPPSWNIQWRVNLSYALLAFLILTPITLTLCRTAFRHSGWVISGLLSFTLGWFFRLVDWEIGEFLPMGSHWLWHIFGAIATWCVIEYFYRLRAEDLHSRRPYLRVTRALSTFERRFFSAAEMRSRPTYGCHQPVYRWDSPDGPEATPTAQRQPQQPRGNPNGFLRPLSFIPFSRKGTTSLRRHLRGDNGAGRGGETAGDGLSGSRAGSGRSRLTRGPGPSERQRFPGSEGLKAGWLFGPVRRSFLTVDTQNAAETMRTQGDEEDFVLRVEQRSQFPAESLDIGCREPATEDGLLQTCSISFHMPGTLAQAFGVMDVVADDPPFGLGHGPILAQDSRKTGQAIR